MNRWVANKLGLVNFWYYDDEVFELSDGKLLLRGSNGSGKSVTMQSFVPLLLDGNKAPERLDPFGTKSRKIENYLLDEDTTERTAYLYIEFKRQEQEHFLTLGMGMKAVKNKPLDSWYFLITDGRRIGKDLFLYRDAGEKLPLTKKQLENEIGEGGIFTTGQREYMKKVNEYLFGFDSVENYEELLSLLINLRSPKLSKDFKPTEIYRILSNSLKVLSEEDLRPMSEAMENMDNYQGNLESYKATQRACKNIKYYYDAYNRYLLVQKAQQLLSQQEQIDAQKKNEKDKQNKLKQNKLELNQLSEEREEKAATLEKAQLQYEQLKDREELTLKQDILELSKAINTDHETLQKKEDQLEKKNENYRDKDNAIKMQQDSYELVLSQLEEQLEDLEEQAELFLFEEGKLLKKELLVEPEKYDFSFITITLDKYLGKLEEAEKEVSLYEKLQQETNEALERKDKKEAAYNQIEEEMQRVNNLLLEAKEDYKVNFVSWQKLARYMPLDKEDQITLFGEIDALEEDTKLIDISQYLGSFYQTQRGEFLAEEASKQAEIEKQEQDIKAIQNQIEALKNAKEIEPDRTEEVLKNRERLTRLGISFSPLYKVVDFKKDIPETTKVAIESALVSMGIIDALIVKEEDRKKAFAFDEGESDKYLRTQGNMMRYNLSQYLEVDKNALEGLSFEAVDHILTGIYLDEDPLAYVDEKGWYGLGILKGKASLNYQSKYIGASARKKHREAVIEEKNQEILEIQKVIAKLKEEGLSIKIKLVELEQEYKNLPLLEDIKSMLVLSHTTKKEMEACYKALLELREAYFDYHQRLNLAKTTLFEKMQGIHIPATKAHFEEAIKTGRQYRDGLKTLQISQNKLQGCGAMMTSLKETLEQIAEDRDNLYYEINQLTQRLKEEEAKRRSLEETLKTTDIEKVEAQIDWCLDIKTHYPDQLKGLDKELGRLEEQINRFTQDIEELIQKAQIEQEKLEGYSKVFLEEYSLGYVVKLEQLSVLEKCKKVVADIPVDLSKKQEEYIVPLMESLSKNGSDLREYGIKTNKILDRIEIKARIESKEVDFYQLIEIINKYIEETNMLLSTEERRIFEDVLLNTISSKITSKIYLSKKWVDKINTLMESMETSSSLRLSLKWVPQRAENEGQLDISELLELLERGDRCSDEDMKKITDHFGAKVKEGIRSYEGTGESRNYHTIIQEVLDYRKWYEFKLYFVKKNEKKKELTNNAFFQFSGGEKAMSMYIPLFSAVYARYANASKDCPRIISMDEAFAGVDENNIRDMFRLLKELDLDFIINSQVLWGDYDTVNNLSICEIIREENDTTVVVLRYHWNGIQKVLL